MLAGSARAQSLSGEWQGVELHLPKANYWPAQLTLKAGPGRALTGVLYQEVGDYPAATGTFEMRGTRTAAGLELEYARVLAETEMNGGTWCLGTVAFTYDAAQEKLTGRSVFRPVAGGDCSTSSFELFRVRLLSAGAVPVAVPSTLRVSGRRVQWFADAALQRPLASGNRYRTVLTKTTTFYLTQDFYPTARRRAVPVTVRVVARRPRARPAAPLPALGPQPLVLPTVLFRLGTAELLPEAFPALNKVAAQLRARPRLRLRVAGHTDRIGPAGSNLLLSEQRAQAVRTFLVQAGIAPARLDAVGYGDTHLLYPAPDARNRRVAIEAVP